MGDNQGVSLRKRVFHKLRDDILNGRYKEKDELKEITLSEELGSSRTPVREALRQLELEGLVSIIPNKGAYVTGISPKDVCDIYVIRSMLEGLSARWAAEHITEEQLERMEEIQVLSEFHLSQNRSQSNQVWSLDGKFHEVLYESSHSRILEHTLTSLHNYVQAARRASIGVKDRARQSVQEHRAVLEAIRARDGSQAEALATTHIINVMHNLQSQGYDQIQEKNQEETHT